MSTDRDPTYFYLLRPPPGDEGLKVRDLVQPGVDRLGAMPPSIRAKLNKQYWTLLHDPALMRFMFQIGYHAQYRRGYGKGVCELRTINNWKGWSSSKQHAAIKKLERIQVIESVKKIQGQRPQVRLLPTAPISVEEGVENPARGYFRVCRGRALDWAIREPEPYALHLLICGAILSYFEQSEDEWRVYFSRNRPDTYPGIGVKGTARRAWERLREVGLIQGIPPDQTREKNARYRLPGISKTSGMLFDDQFFVPPSPKRTKTNGQKRENELEEARKQDEGLNYPENQHLTADETRDSNHIPDKPLPKTGLNPSTEVIKDSDKKGTGNKGKKNNTKQASVSFSFLESAPPLTDGSTNQTDSTRTDPDRTGSNRTDPTSSSSTRTDPEFQTEEFKHSSRLRVWAKVGARDQKHILQLTRKILNDPRNLPNVAGWRGSAENRHWDPFFAAYPTPGDYPAIFTRLLEEIAESQWYRPQPGHHRLFRLRCAERHLRALLEQRPGWACLVRSQNREQDPVVAELLKMQEEGQWKDVQNRMMIFDERLPDIAVSVMIELARIGDGRRLTHFTALTVALPGLSASNAQDLAACCEILTGLSAQELEHVLARCQDLADVLDLIPEEPLNAVEQAGGVPYDLPQALFTKPETFWAWMDGGVPEIDWKSVCVELQEAGDLSGFPSEISWLVRGLSPPGRRALADYVEKVNGTRGQNWKSESRNWKKLFGEDRAEEFVQAYGDQIPALLYWMGETRQSGLFPKVLEQGKRLLQTEAARRLADELEGLNPLHKFSDGMPSFRMANHCAAPEGPWTEEMKTLSSVLNASNRDTYLGDLTAAFVRLATISPEALAAFFSVHKPRATEMAGDEWVRIIDGLVAQSEQFARWVELRRWVWDWYAQGRYLEVPIEAKSPWLKLPPDHPALLLLEFESPESANG